MEKRWGILYKCLTTRAVHLDLLPSLDADLFLMFFSQRGFPVESDQRTNVRGGERELYEAFKSMSPDLQQKTCTMKDSIPI